MILEATNRMVSQMYAKALGYFWLPCPRCGQMFGGHEVQGSLVKTVEFNRDGSLAGGISMSTCCPPYEDYASVIPRIIDPSGVK